MARSKVRNLREPPKSAVTEEEHRRGAIEVGIDLKLNRIVLEFSMQISTIGMHPDFAESFAKAILEKVDVLRQVPRPVEVPLGEEPTT